jgi:hypothetical protein
VSQELDDVGKTLRRCSVSQTSFSSWGAPTTRGPHRAPELSDASINGGFVIPDYSGLPGRGLGHPVVVSLCVRGTSRGT